MAAVLRPSDKNMHVILTLVDSGGSIKPGLEIRAVFIVLTTTLDTTALAFFGDWPGTGELLSYWQLSVNQGSNGREQG